MRRDCDSARNATGREHKRWQDGQEAVIQRVHPGVTESARKGMKRVELRASPRVRGG
jgi:hypothetical protein